MIEKMKKLSLLMHARQRDRVLSELQRLGLVHLELESESVADRQARLKALAARFAVVVSELETLEPEAPAAGAQGVPGPAPWPVEAKKWIERLEFLEEQLLARNNFREALSELQDARRSLLPWGDFDVSRVDQLKTYGVSVVFYVGSARVFDEYDFKDTVLEEIAREGDRVFFLVFSHRGSNKVLPFQEIEIPRASLSELAVEIGVVRARVESSAGSIAQFRSALPELKAELARLTTEMRLEEARHNLRGHKDESIFSIVGWFPKSKEAAIHKFLSDADMAYEIDNPTARDRVPIKLKNPVGAGLFEPITKIFALPSYFELDPTLFFAPFFTVFFGLCLGDVGYGLVVTAVAMVAYFFVPKHVRGITVLAGILGISTIVAGVLLNTFFGKALFVVPGEEKAIFQQGGELALFASYTVQGRTTFPAMTLALLLGFIQVFVGIALSAVNALRQNGFQYMLKPVGMLLILAGGTIVAVHGDFLRLGFNTKFVIGPIAVGPALANISPATGTNLVIAGLVIFFLFCNPAVNFFVRPLLGLWDFYGFVTGLLGDFLSYIRLFALGLASGLLGNAFNHIAFMILPRTADGPVYASPLIVISIVILILGHTLNLGLSMLGSFVHPLRLTFVEFYKNIQFQGGGQEYVPFAVEKTTVDS